MILKYFTIIITLPLFLFIGFVPMGFFVWIQTPLLHLICRVHNNINPKHKIKIRSSLGEVEGMSDYQTFTEWYKSFKWYGDASIHFMFLRIIATIIMFATSPTIPFIIYEIIKHY